MHIPFQLAKYVTNAVQDPFKYMKMDSVISNDLQDHVAALNSFAFTTHIDVVMVYTPNTMRVQCPCSVIFLAAA